MFHRDGERLLDDGMLPGAKSVSRLRVVKKWRGGNVDELHAWHREHHLSTLHVR